MNKKDLDTITFFIEDILHQRINSAQFGGGVTLTPDKARMVRLEVEFWHLFPVESTKRGEAGAQVAKETASILSHIAKHLSAAAVELNERLSGEWDFEREVDWDRESGSDPEPPETP